MGEWIEMKTAQAQAEWMEAERRRVAREAKKEKRREIVRRIACPECGSGASLLCRHPTGQTRIQNHQARWDLALAQGIIRRASR